MEETQMEASQSLNESRVSHASGFLVRAAQRGACAGDAGTPGNSSQFSLVLICDCGVSVLDGQRCWWRTLLKTPLFPSTIKLQFYDNYCKYQCALSLKFLLLLSYCIKTKCCFCSVLFGSVFFIYYYCIHSEKRYKSCHYGYLFKMYTFVPILCLKGVN